VNNTATVDSDEITPLSDSDDVQIVENAPLLITKDFTNPPNDAAGDTPEETATAGSSGNTFFIIVTNTGTSTADNVVITDVVPAALTVTDVSGTLGAQVANPTLNDNNIVWSIPSLGAGQSMTLTVTYSVGADVNTQLVLNTASVDSDEIDPISDSDDVQVQGGIIVIGPDKCNCAPPVVQIVNSATGAVVTSFLAYEPTYRGGVRIATGDLNGDGVDEIITAPGRNHTPLVKVFNQMGSLLYSFLTFGSKFVGGVNVAVGDVNGDGKNDIITAMSYNGNQVTVFKNTSPNPAPFNPLQFTTFSTFTPFGTTFKGGAVVAAADLGTPAVVGGKKTLDSTVLDGRAEVIVGNGSGMRSTIKIFTYFAASNVATLVRTFLPFSTAFRGGVSIDVANFNDDGPVGPAGNIPDIIVAAGNGGTSQVQVLNGKSGNVLLGFTAYAPPDTPSTNAPVHVASQDSNGDGIADLILTAQGTDGATRKIRKFAALDGHLVDQIMESSPDFCGAYFLATIKGQPPRRPLP